MERPTPLSDQVPERLLLDFKILNETDGVTLLGLAGGGDAYIDRYSLHGSLPGERTGECGKSPPGLP